MALFDMNPTDHVKMSKNMNFADSKIKNNLANKQSEIAYLYLLNSIQYT